MSAECTSISGGEPFIHSATARPMPGPSFTQLAATDQRPLTSGVSPRTGCPSGVMAMSPLIPYPMLLLLSPRSSGTSSRACSSCGSKSCRVKGSSVGERADSAMEGISSGSTVMGRWA